MWFSCTHIPAGRADARQRSLWSQLIWEQKQTSCQSKGKNNLIMRPDPRLIPRNGVRLLSLCGRSAFVSRSRCDGCKISRLARPESLSACLQIVQMSQKEEEEFIFYLFFFFWIPPACPWKVMHPWLTNAVWELMRVARTLMPADRTPTQCLARRRDLLKTRQPPFHRLHSSCPASPFLFSPPFAIFSSLFIYPHKATGGGIAAAF